MFNTKMHKWLLQHQTTDIYTFLDCLIGFKHRGRKTTERNVLPHNCIKKVSAIRHRFVTSASALNRSIHFPGNIQNNAVWEENVVL